MIEGIEDHTQAELELIAALEAEDYYQSEQSLSHFTRAAWDVLEPSTRYVHNWHIDCVAEHLEAVDQGEIRRLLINIPPRHMKSIQVTVCYPVWAWLKKPSKRFMFASYAASLSLKHAVDRRSLMESQWFRRQWADRFSFTADQNQKSEYSNTKTGAMISTSTGGAATGKGADVLITDDPHDPESAASDKERETSLRWFDQTWSTRLNDDKTGAMVVVMQRLHQKDISGHVIAKGGWTHLNLPAEAPKKTVIIMPLSKKEIVREEGALLWPERQGEKELAQKKVDLGSMGYNAQYAQDPKVSTDGFFKRAWWKTYRELPMQRLKRIQIWDCAEEPGVTNDYSVCATWDQTASGYYLVDLWREKVAFPQLEAAAKALYAQHQPTEVMIEKKSAGTQLIQNLQANTTLPIIPYQPGNRSKVVRAAGASPTVEAGNCYLPENRPWVEVFIGEHQNFPNGEHDDTVDTTSMMVERFKGPIARPGIRSL